MRNEDELRELRNTDLFFFLPGYDPGNWLSAGNGRIRNKQHDSCIITENKGYAWNSCGLKGKNPITFLMDFYGLDFKSACDALENGKCFFSEMPQNVVVPSHCEKEYIPERAGGDFDNVRNYLRNYRKIGNQVITWAIDYGLIYEESKTGNLVFTSEYAGKTHYEIHGTNPRKRFKRVSGSGVIFLPVKPKTNRVFIFESGIDLLSFFQLTGASGYYFSLSGSATRTAETDMIIQNEPGKTFYCCTDNDDAGNHYADKYKSFIRLSPALSDFNDDLVSLACNDDHSENVRRNVEGLIRAIKG
jgi:hypothetical protein